MSFWAKTGTEGNYLPLERHLADAGAVGARLFDIALGDRQRAWLAAAFSVSVAEARALAVFLVAIHDCGKLSPTFQGLVPELAARVLPPGLKVAATDGLGAPLRHDGISGALLTEWAIARGASKPLAERLAATVSGHHGTPRSAREVRKRGRLELRRDLAWRPAQDSLLDGLAEANGLGDLAAYGEPSDGAVLTLAGLVSAADWLASDAHRFPVQAGTRTQSAALAESAVTAAGWTPRAAPATDDFTVVFGFAPRAAQAAVVEALTAQDEPSLLLLEDRTGSGKTEAALWASLVALQGGARGLYVGLPTKATADQFHGRAQRFLSRLWPDLEPDELRLLHGGAHLRDDDPVPGGVDGGSGDGEARSWFSGARRGLLAPYAVGTVDQALLAVLDARHYPVRLWGLHGKVVVLDEVHAYDVYTGRLLERLVAWLGACGCSVVMLSATLPARRRAALCEAYVSGLGGCLESATEGVGYPRLTLANRDAISFVAVDDDRPGRSVRLESGPSPDDQDEVVTRVLEEVEAGGCAGLICSTVALAQARFAAVRERIEAGTEVLLLHARMRPLERAPVERRIAELLGPKGSRPARTVVVGTQVIEQSLDIDFDVILTDLAPVDLLIQRAGRVHRHAGRSRAPRHHAPRLVVLDTPGVAADRRLPHGAGAVYVPAILARTRLLLHGRQELREPEDLDELIEGVYGESVPAAATLDEREAIGALDAKAAGDAVQLGGWAVDAMIGQPDGERRPWELHDTPLGDPDAPGAHGRNSAATRWTERPTLNVVVLMPEEAALLDGSPKELLRRAVGVSAPEIVRALLAGGQLFQPPRWARIGALRHHFLVLLGPDGRALPADGAEPPLQWDAELGVLSTGANRVQPR